MSVSYSYPERIRSAVIFGGAGFIGTHLVAELASLGCEEIVVADTSAPKVRVPGVQYVRHDVRAVASIRLRNQSPTIFNLAAVHRTPGHPDSEYHDVNENGAVRVTDYASRIGAPLLVFTSSIAVYGPSEQPLSEGSPLVPVSAYGRSKVAAESIHRDWAASAPDRRLVIARPATVFGPGEGGNFTRLARALRQRRFLYPGRQTTRKGCGYVGELLRTFRFAASESREPEVIYNFAYPQSPELATIVRCFCGIGGYPAPLGTAPLRPMLLAAEAARRIGSENLHPERVLKLVRSTNIVPQWLLDSGYRFETNVESGLRKWYDSAPAGSFV